VIGECAAAQGRQKNDSRKSRSGDQSTERVIGGDSGDAHGGGAHGGYIQSGCGVDGAEKPVTPDP
jgi:hypothetical protein